VTLVITDVDDQIPTFNRNNFTVAVPEDVGNKSEFSIFENFKVSEIELQVLVVLLHFTYPHNLFLIFKIFENIFSGSDTPLPDLNIVVTDEDVGKNAEFDLVCFIKS
jgi:hypothetical protein